MTSNGSDILGDVQSSPFTSNMFSILKVTTLLWWTFLHPHCSSAYELQDTIHTLKEENLHLQHRLENLTRALRDLKHLLTEHAKGKSYFLIGLKMMTLFEWRCCIDIFFPAFNSFW